MQDYVGSPNQRLDPAKIDNFYGPPALNYGGVGMIIGHEMMHGYDENGVKYDADSNLRNWATPEFLKKVHREGALLARVAQNC
ncbi:hypothetical protein MTO96_048773, partial [Rhipicephalus appendiculatus]